MIRVNERRPPRLVMPVHMGVAGFLRWGLFHAETGALKRSSGLLAPHRGWYPNVIVDAGMDAVMGGGIQNTESLGGLYGQFIAVGTDNTAPAQTDTSLGVEVARADTRFNQTEGDDGSSPPNYHWVRITYEFTKSEANDTLAELGLFANASGGPMWMRQLFKDSGGASTTITKTSDEVLRIQYELRLYPDLTVKNKTQTVTTRGSDVSTTVTYQPQNVDEAFDGNNLLRPHDQGGLGRWDVGRVRVWEDNTPPSDFVSVGPASGNTPGDNFEIGASLQAYTASSFQRQVDYGAMDETQGNFPSGIGAFTGYEEPARPFIRFFDPRIDKTDTDELTGLSTLFTLSRVAV